MIRKLMTVISVLFLVLGSGCKAPSDSMTEQDGFQVVTTVFPIYDWTREITAGTDTNVQLLMKNGSDMHNFQPSAQDIIAIHSADLFIYIGGESDEWVKDVLKEAPESLHAVCLMDVLKDALIDEEILEGMTADEEHEEHEHDEEKDEHIWLSLGNAAACTDSIASELSRYDAAHAGTYKENQTNYAARLTELNKAYQQAVSEGSTDTVVFADRFPFVYLMKELGLNHYAAFPGCSAETQASFETVIFLSSKLDELNLRHVFTIENSSSDIADTVIASSNDKTRDILVLNSMQSVTAEQAEKNTYLSIMESNLEVLKKGLN